jgi:hypothetical protein
VTRKPTNIAASVRARLLRLAKERGEDFQLVLTRYANERLLYRLASSPHRSRFVLKGAFLLTIWTGSPHRATRDVDLLGFGDPGVDQVRAVLEQVLAIDVENDGVTFDELTSDHGAPRVATDSFDRVAQLEIRQPARGRIEREPARRRHRDLPGHAAPGRLARCR